MELLIAKTVSPVNIRRLSAARHARRVVSAHLRRPGPALARRVLPLAKQPEDRVPRLRLTARSARKANLLLPDVNLPARWAVSPVQPLLDASVRPGPLPQSGLHVLPVTFAQGARHFHSCAPPAQGGVMVTRMAPSVSTTLHISRCCGITPAITQIVCATRGSALKTGELPTPLLI
jgi:hypothetical protein